MLLNLDFYALPKENRPVDLQERKYRVSAPEGREITFQRVSDSRIFYSNSLSIVFLIPF